MKHVAPNHADEADMAKKTAIAPKPPAKAEKGQQSIINLKGSEAYREWLAGVSRQTHIPAAAIVRLGLALWAEANGHKAPPEK